MEEQKRPARGVALPQLSWSRLPGARFYTAYAESETHRGFEVVDVGFGVSLPSAGDERQGKDEPGAPVR